MAEIITLRVIHILGGIFWVGSGVFTTFFLGPALARTGHAAGQVMAALHARKLFTVLPIVAVLTILSGLRLMWLTSAGFSPEYFASSRGSMFSTAGGAAIVAFLLALFVVRPAALRTTALAISGGSASGLAEARRRMTIMSMVVTLLLLFAATGMAVARYLK